tara:strand:- start:335 stop:592 length:258 start_codon:yes stop_codon:yes gene_type:complete
MIKEKKQKPNYESFYITLVDNNWNTEDHKELSPIMLKNHPCEDARQIYDLGFKLCKWSNDNNQKYAVSLDGSYIPFDEGKNDKKI